MKTLNLYTNGAKFYLSSTTTEYTGYYNITETGTILTGRAPTDESTELIPIPSESVQYNSIVTDELPEPITIFVPSPSTSDYKRGWFSRYFARQANVLDATYYEIDEAQFTGIDGGQKPFYVGVQLRWKISGPEYDVIDNFTMRIIEPGVFNTNDRSIKLLESSHPLLKFRLQNLIEFWNGQSGAYFAPPLVEEKKNPNKLVYKKADIS